jgi:hypothetical protein
MGKFLKPIPVVDRRTGKVVRFVEGNLREVLRLAAAETAVFVTAVSRWGGSRRERIKYA